MKIGQALWLQNDMVFQSSNAVFSSEPMSVSEDFLQKKTKNKTLQTLHEFAVFLQEDRHSCIAMSQTVGCSLRTSVWDSMSNLQKAVSIHCLY